MASCRRQLGSWEKKKIKQKVTGDHVMSTTENQSRWKSSEDHQSSTHSLTAGRFRILGLSQWRRQTSTNSSFAYLVYTIIFRTFAITIVSCLLRPLTRAQRFKVTQKCTSTALWEGLASDGTKPWGQSETSCRRQEPRWGAVLEECGKNKGSRETIWTSRWFTSSSRKKKFCTTNIWVNAFWARAMTKNLDVTLGLRGLNRVPEGPASEQRPDTNLSWAQKAEKPTCWIKTLPALTRPKFN